MNFRLGVTIWLLSLVAGTNAQIVGNVTGWGDSSSGQLTFPPGLTNVVSVAAGLQHGAGVRDDGSVLIWGTDFGQISSMPSGLAGMRAITAGNQHTVALRSNGTVVAWGTDAAATNVPASLTSVRAVAAGEAYTLALRSNGTVVAWGSGSVTNLPLLGFVRTIVAGNSHALALHSNGTVTAWGDSAFGKTPAPAGLAGVRMVTAGGQHSIALKSNNTFSVWGDNSHKQLNIPVAGNIVSGLFSGANHSGATLIDGKVVCWGDNTFDQTNSVGASNVLVAVAQGNVNLAIYLQAPSITTHPVSQNVSAGANVTFTVVAVGSPTLQFQWRKNGTNIVGAFNQSYQVNNAQPTNSGGYSVVVTNAVGSVTSLVATLTVSSAPAINTQPQSQTVVVGTNVTFTVGAVGTAPLRYQWKKNATNILNATNTFYQISTVDPSHAGIYSVTITNFFGTTPSSNAVLTVVTPPDIQEQPQSQTVLAGSSVTFTVLSTNATTIQWQHGNTNLPGETSSMLTINRAQLSDAGTYVAVLGNGFASIASSPATLNVVTPSSASEVVLWGQDMVLVGNEFIDMAPPLGLVNVKAVTAGDGFNLALRNDGTVVGWGDNQFGQAGLPPSVLATAIAAGANHTLAITNGRVGAWGLNTSGQATPPNITNAVAIAAYGNLSMALRGDGKVFVWGDTNAGQGIFPPSVTNVVGIAAGVEHCLAVRSNGTVVAWGSPNTYGQARPPFSVTNANAGVVAVAAGAYHSLALKSNGTVVVWGRGDFGQTNVPSTVTNVIAIAAGSHHSLALRRDGAVISWGNDNFGQSQTPGDLVASGIGAGAARSLAIRRMGFKLLSPILLSPNQIRIEVRNGDGSFIPASRATNIEVIASADVSAPKSSWTKLTNSVSVSSNGVSTFTDDPTTQSRRFYNVREQ